jgi:sirohydrochlorin ferrochelatase
MAEGLKEKEEALERLVEERRARERDEHAGVASVQRALADLEEQVNRVRALLYVCGC